MDINDAIKLYRSVHEYQHKGVVNKDLNDYAIKVRLNDKPLDLACVCDQVNRTLADGYMWIYRHLSPPEKNL